MAREDGAHAYGFPSPDSDLDLKAVHIADTGALLGLHPPPTAANPQEFVDGHELDYTSNELGQCVRGLIAGDGNMLERVLSHAWIRSRDPTCDALGEQAREQSPLPDAPDEDAVAAFESWLVGTRLDAITRPAG